MTEPWDDDTLLAALAGVLRAAPPAEVLDGAKDLFTWRTLDAELAELTFDSLLDAEPEAVARSAAQPRILTFEAGGLTVEVEVDAGPAGRRLLGQLVPAQTAELQLIGGDAPALASADAFGRFVLDLPAGRRRFTLRIRPADGGTVESSCVTL